MKKILSLSLAVLALVTVVPQLMAVQYTVETVGYYGPYQRGSGGEITLAPGASLAALLSDQYVAGVTAGMVKAGTFQTFCVEESAYIYPNTMYYAEISQETQLSGRALTQGAAGLYDSFLKGTLAYDYNGRDDGSTVALQKAIWYFMGWIPSLSNSYVTLGNSLGGFALNDLAGDGSALKYDVAVLNMWTASGGDRQDQLIGLKSTGGSLVPDGGMTVALLGLALGGLGLVSRKICKE